MVCVGFEPWIGGDKGWRAQINPLSSMYVKIHFSPKGARETRRKCEMRIGSFDQ